MKKFTIFLLVVFAASLAFAQTQMPASKLGRDRGNPNDPASRQLTGTLTSTNFYVANSTMDLTFELELTNTDDEYGDSLAMAFGGAFTVNGSSDDPFPSPITGGQTAEALNGVTGQIISWGDNDNTFGGIEPGTVISFSVNVTVASGTTGPQVVGFFVSGDEFGASPGPLFGSVTINPAPNTGVPLLDNDLFEAFTEIGSSTQSANFTLSNLGVAALPIDSTRLTGNEFTSSFSASSVPALGNHTFSFTYTPTNLVDDVDTFYIFSGTTTLKIALNGYAYGNGVVIEDFEGGVFPPCTWQNQDVDGDGQGWFIYPFIPHRGQLSVASSSWNGVPLTPDNYLILPQITPDSSTGGKALLRYWVAAQDADFPRENYSVVVSTTDSSTTSFTTTAFTEVLSSTDWKQVTVDLKQFHGQDIFVAFRHFNVSDEFLFKIDDIRMPPLTNPNPVFPALAANLTVTNEGCEGDMLGGAAINPTGGSGLYGVSWSTGDLGGSLDSLGGGNYYVIVFDNCGTAPDSQAFTVGFDNAADDASFNYDETTYCNTGGNPAPTVTGLTGGTFFSPGGLTVNATTGEIDVANSTVGGPFSVIYQTNGPCPSSDTTFVSIDDCTGFEDLQSQGMEVYPNPNNGQFVIHNQGQPRTADIQVLDIQGRSVFARTVQLGFGEKYQVELNDVTPGVYLLKVYSEEQVGIERVIVR